MKQHEMLLQIFNLMELKGVWPNQSKSEIVKALLYLHGKGWLYATTGDDGNVDMFAAMYRVSENSKAFIGYFPNKEEGDILYIPLFVSVAKDKMKASRCFKKIVSTMDIKEIVFMERGEKLKRFKKKETQNGRQNSKNRHPGSNVSGRSKIYAGA